MWGVRHSPLRLGTLEGDHPECLVANIKARLLVQATMAIDKANAKRNSRKDVRRRRPSGEQTKPYPA